MRELIRNATAIEQFPALEADGWQKRTGLSLPADFSIAVWLNGQPNTTAVAITEIGISGEYRMEWTPTTNGYMIVEVLIEFSKTPLRFGYQIVDATTNNQALKLDLAATVGPAAMTPGSLGDRLMNADPTQSFQQSRDSLQGIRRLIKA